MAEGDQSKAAEESEIFDVSKVQNIIVLKLF